MNHLKALLILFLLEINVSYAQAPGGVAPCEVWTRAEIGVYNNAGTTLATDGQAVLQWNDQATAIVQNMATYVGGPIYNNLPGKFLNFNPRIHYVAGNNGGGDGTRTTSTPPINLSSG